MRCNITAEDTENTGLAATEGEVERATHTAAEASSTAAAMTASRVSMAKTMTSCSVQQVQRVQPGNTMDAWVAVAVGEGTA